MGRIQNTYVFIKHKKTLFVEVFSTDDKLGRLEPLFNPNYTNQPPNLTIEIIMNRMVQLGFDSSQPTQPPAGAEQPDQALAGPEGAVVPSWVVLHPSRTASCGSPLNRMTKLGFSQYFFIILTSLN